MYGSMWCDVSGIRYWYTVYVPCVMPLVKASSCYALAARLTKWHHMQNVITSETPPLATNIL